MADAVFLSARLDGRTTAGKKFNSVKRELYPIARDESSRVLKKFYQPAVKNAAPIGRHFSDPQQHPYRDGKPRRGGGLRKAIDVERLGSMQNLARVIVRDEKDRWGVSAAAKAEWVIRGRRTRHAIVAKNASTLAFIWENAPSNILARQHGKENRQGYAANLVFFLAVRAGQFRANRFHETAWKNVKTQVKEGLANEVSHRIVFEFQR